MTEQDSKPGLGAQHRESPGKRKSKRGEMSPHACPLTPVRTGVIKKISGDVGEGEPRALAVGM